MVPIKDEADARVAKSYKPKYAKGFEIQEMSDSSARIILFNLEKEGDTLQVIRWKKQEVLNVACLSTTHIAFIDQLGMIDHLKGTGFAELVKNSNARQRIQETQITNLSIGHDIDDEKIYAINPQLFFVYPFGGTDYRKFLEKGIGCVQVSEYLENHPLGRAEWIKVFGVLLGREMKADSIFNRIASSYEELTARVNVSTTNLPDVFTGSYGSGNWFAPPGNSFAAKLIKDAGANYIFCDSLASGNLVIPFEKLLESAYNVDFWGKIIFEKGEVTLTSFTDNDPRLVGLKSSQNGNLFYCNTEECDYHGDAVLAPDVMLEDLIRIFHPEIASTHESIYFKKIK